MVNIQWSMVNGQWSMVNGQCLTLNGECLTDVAKILGRGESNFRTFF